MKQILFSILFFIWLIIPATALLAQTPQEVQQQMRQATEDLRKQIADHEKQIAETRKNKEDAETIKGMENELVQLKQQLATMDKAGKSVASIPTSMMDKASQQVMVETDNSTKRIPERKTALVKAGWKQMAKVKLSRSIRMIIRQEKQITEEWSS